MKKFIVLLAGIAFLTFWSCSSDSDLTSNTETTLEVEEVERIISEAEMQAMIANLTDSEREYVDQKMEEIKTAIKKESHKTGAALRAAVIGAVTASMNTIIATSPCPNGSQLDRFRTISSTQTYNPDPFPVHANGDPHTCTAPNLSLIHI